MNTAARKQQYTRWSSIQIRLPDLLKGLVAFPATQGHGVKKKEVPILDNYWVPPSN